MVLISAQSLGCLDCFLRKNPFVSSHSVMFLQTTVHSVHHDEVKGVKLKCVSCFQTKTTSPHDLNRVVSSLLDRSPEPSGPCIFDSDVQGRLNNARHFQAELERLFKNKRLTVCVLAQNAPCFSSSSSAAQTKSALKDPSDLRLRNALSWLSTL